MFKSGSAGHVEMLTLINNNKNTSKMLNHLNNLFVIFLLLIPVEGKLFAEEKIVTGKFVVSFTAEKNQKSWVVNALEQNVYNDLSGYARVVPFKKSIDEDQLCKNRDIDCILDIYKKLNIDALMLGKVGRSDIEYETYDIQNKYLVETGSIDIGSGSNLLKLRLGAFNAFKPFIEKGGILDKRKYNAVSDDRLKEASNKVAQEKSNKELKNQLLIFLAIFTCFPYLLSLIGKPRRHPERAKLVFHWFYPFLIVSLLIIGYLYILETDVSGNIFNILSLFDGYQVILTGLGGIVWGFFLIMNIKIIIPHLQGIERVKPNILFPLFQSLFITILIKTIIIVAFYVSYFYGVVYLGRHFSIDQELIVLLLFPFSGLYIIYWTALMLDTFSMSIDVKLSGNDLDYKNVWNLKIRKYFIANLKRNGVILNKSLVEDVVFLAGQNRGVICYGGGFSRPRIAIEKDLIKYSLGEVDDFNPEETVAFTRKVFDKDLRQSSVFKIVANLSAEYKKKKLFKSRYDKKKIEYLKSAQKFFQCDLKLDNKKRIERSLDVIQGIVIPRLDADDDLPSLMCDNVMDIQVVNMLLQENTGDNYHYDAEAEVDDSNERDKDFLFGAILLKFGELLRHEDVFATIYYYLRYKKGVKSPPYNFIFSKYFAVVADTFVVINFGLNHLMQYLHYQATNISSFLTIKGIPSEMLKSQDGILISAKQAADERKPKLIRTDELERIVWLSRFCQGSFELQQGIKSRAKQIFKWSFALGIVYMASIVMINSYNYHPKYLQTIENEKHEIAEAIKKHKIRKGKKDDR